MTKLVSSFFRQDSSNLCDSLTIVLTQNNNILHWTLHDLVSVPDSLLKEGGGVSVADLGLLKGRLGFRHTLLHRSCQAGAAEAL